MSDAQREASILILQIIGFILITFTLLLVGISVVCILGLEPANLVARCGDGTMKEIGFTIIGAAGALWGASMMKGTKA